MLSKKIIGQLLQDSIDFFNIAIDWFDEKPKHSVVFFSSALELILKARLMHEHWSLVMDLPSKKDPSIETFKKGDFKSLGLNRLVERIKSIIENETFSQNEISCFKSISKFRNKAIHFTGDYRSKETLEKIAIEQSKGWYFIRKKLKKWKKFLPHYEEQPFREIDIKMKKYNIYTETIFSEIELDLKQLESQGIIFRNCRICQKRSSEISIREKFIHYANCKVCHFNEYFLSINCLQEECEGRLEIFNGEESEDDFKIYCSLCSKSPTYEEIVEFLNKNVNFAISPKDMLCEPDVVCDFCWSDCDTVIKHEYFFICTSCFFITDEQEMCEWCNLCHIGGGPLEASGLFGCSHCDGNTKLLND